MNLNVSSAAAALALLAFGLCPSLLADSLKGRVLDPDGKAVPGAEVRLFDRKGGQVRKVTANGQGEFSFQSIPASDYLLEGDTSTAALSGSKELKIEGDQTTDLDLKIAPSNVEVFVTAAGDAQSVQEVAKAIDIVDSEQISVRDEISVTDAIRILPGIRVQQLEGPGSFVSIKTRGLRNSDTSVLIDGIRFRDATSLQGDATSMLEDMTLVDADRIEFLRGSGSSLYGSHALGGVLNVTSRSGGGQTHGDIRVEGGGLGTFRGVLGIGGGLLEDRFTYSGAVSHNNVTKGPRDGLPYRNTSTQGSALYSFNPRISLSGRVWYSNSYNATTESSTYTGPMVSGSPGLVQAIPLPISELEKFERGQSFTAGNATYIPGQIDPDARRLGSFFTGAGSFQHHVSPATSYRINLQRVDTKRTFLDAPGGPGSFEPIGDSKSVYDGYINTLQGELSQRLGDYNQISAGYEFENEQYYQFDGYNVSSTAIDLRQRSHAFYIQDRISLLDGQLQLAASGRVQTFRLREPVISGGTSPYSGVGAVEPPTAWIGDGSIAYMIRSSNTKLRSHVGNSFRAPAGYERFGGDGFAFYGDPNLAPERAISVDGGIDQWLFDSRLQLGATYFYTKLQQQIIFGSVPAAPYNRSFGGYLNGGSGIARGVELSTNLSATRQTQIQMSYTYTNSESRTPTFASINLYDSLGVSKHAFTMTLTQWIGSRINVAFDMSSFSDYTTPLFGLDFSSRAFRFNGPTKGDVVVHYDYPLTDTRKLDFYAKVENVFNQRAFENGFIGPKAWVVGGIRLKY